MMKHQTMKDSIKHWCLHLNINNSDSSNHCNLKYKLPNLKKDGVRFMGYGMEHYLEKLIMLFGRYLLQKFRYALKNGKEARETILLIGYSPKDHLRRIHGMEYAKEILGKKQRTRLGCNANQRRNAESYFNKQQQFKKRPFIKIKELERKSKKQNCLLIMDDGVVNWGEHTVEEEESNHALMAISSNKRYHISKT
ncbi:hypothetical protein Tco_1106237 [Tanacetum coccineum]